MTSQAMAPADGDRQTKVPLTYDTDTGGRSLDKLRSVDEKAVLIPKSLHPASEEATHYILSRTPVGAALCAGTIISFVLLTLAMFALVPERSAFGERELRALLLACAIQAGGLLCDVVKAYEPVQHRVSWMQRTLLIVKTVAMLTNLLLCSVPSPVAADYITGRAYPMLRWAEWVVLSFTMTFIVEAVDATDLAQPLLAAGSQSLSSLCGLLLPWMWSAASWAAMLAVSFALFLVIFWRLHVKETNARRLDACKTASTYERRRAQLAARLMRQCAGTWTGLVAVWTADAAVRLLLLPICTQREAPVCAETVTDWALCADCLVDVVAKLLYSMVIQQLSEAEPIKLREERLQLSEERVKTVWQSASDILLLSQLHENDATDVVLTFASPSIRSLVEQKEVVESWTEGKVHKIEKAVPEPDGGSSSPVSTSSAGDWNEHCGNYGTTPGGSIRATKYAVRCSSIEGIVSFAWQKHNFMCLLVAGPSDSASSGLSPPASPAPRPPCSPAAAPPRAEVRSGGEGPAKETDGSDEGGGVQVCEVHATPSEEGLVICIRNVTDRVRLAEAEKEVLAAAIERQKDEEANRFTRHEVKNGVLAAMSQCDSLSSHFQKACDEGLMPEASHGAHNATQRSMLTGLRYGLNQTLEAVLSEAMAREVVHGLYVTRTEPVQVEEVLKLSGVSVGRKGRLMLRTKPQVLPVVDLDPRLLLHVYRNAVSNAAKYGRVGGTVATEIEIADETLTIRVINEPGHSHAALRRLRDPSVVFAKGTRFHMTAQTTATARTSKGDGAWIMAKCVESLQGTCGIRFEEERTVFEMRCPALECRDESLIKEAQFDGTVYALGVDDCEFQRFILGEIFEMSGIDEANVTLLGENVADIEGLADRIVQIVSEIPPDACLLAIVDENLDLPAPLFDTVSGSAGVEAARARLSPQDERRLLALVRSANDSKDDQAVYAERAHGFLSKCPSEPDRHAIMRAWVRRFATKGIKTALPALEPAPKEGEEASSLPPRSARDANQTAAAAELTRISRLVEDGWQSMSWGETWRWLHRMKGVIGSVKASYDAVGDGPSDSRAAGGSFEAASPQTPRAELAIGLIEDLRGLDDVPADFDVVWIKLKSSVRPFM